MLEPVLQDFKYGLRVLLRTPGFSVAAIAIIALGIGANAAIFSVVNAVIVRRLPLADANRVVRLWHVPPPHLFPGRKTFSVSPANYLDWSEQAHAFDRMAAYAGNRLTLTGSGEPAAVLAGVVSTEFFQVLGIQPSAGRSFVTDDGQSGHDHVVILGEALWRSRFGADPALIGRSLRLNGESYSVIGVVPTMFRLPERAELWIPLVWANRERAVRGIHNYGVIARLRANASVRQAQTEMNTISGRLAEQYPQDNAGWGAVVIPLHDDIVGDVRPALLVLFGAVALVLLIACANLTNLLLAKTLARGKEVAVRSALGASTSRVVQQILCETILLAVTGGIAGLAIAKLGITAIVDFAGPRLPRANEITLDGSVALFAIVISALSGVIAGIAPAWRLTRANVANALKQGLGRGGSETGAQRTRNALVVSEVALALILLIGAGLLIRSLSLLRHVDPGIDPRNITTMAITIPSTKYPDPAHQAQFFQTVLARIRALPGVEAASGIDSLPFSEGSTEPIAIEGRPATKMSEQPEVAVRAILPEYARTVRMRIVAGREFTDADTVERPAVVLVSESMARRFWPNENPLGKRLTRTFLPGIVREVVGVVADVKLLGLDLAEPVATLYVPSQQRPVPFQSIVVRTVTPPEGIGASLIRAIHDVDAEQPILNVRTMEEVIGESLSQHRFSMLLLVGFAGLALLLATIEIYSVLAYTVRQRVREIGIRIALGAPLSGVLRMVLIEGLRPIAIGIAIGVASAIGLGRVLATMIYGVTARDVTTFVSVAILVAIVGVLASLLPAYRATRVDPMTALRCE